LITAVRPRRAPQEHDNTLSARGRENAVLRPTGDPGAAAPKRAAGVQRYEPPKSCHGRYPLQPYRHLAGNPAEAI